MSNKIITFLINPCLFSLYVWQNNENWYRCRDRNKRKQALQNGTDYSAEQNGNKVLNW